MMTLDDFSYSRDELDTMNDPNQVDLEFIREEDVEIRKLSKKEPKKYGDVKMESKITTSSLMKDYQNVCDYTLAHADELKAKVEAILEPVEGLYNYSPHNFFLAQMQL